MMAGTRRKTSVEVMALAAGAAVGLAAIDVNYSAKGRISKIYLLDAILELGLVGLGVTFWNHRPTTVSRARNESDCLEPDNPPRGI